MVFTRSLALFVLASLTIGCTTLPQYSDPSIPTEDLAVDGADQSRLPNPYLAHQKPVPEQARIEFEAAQKAMAAKKWDRAEAILRQMTQAYPTLSGPYVNLGLVYRQQEQHDLAADAFAEAIKVNPLNDTAYNQLAILHRERGKFAEAEGLYLKALEVWPHNPVAHRNLAILYDLYMGRLADALHHYQMSQKLADESERKLAGWIVDLQRRIAEQQQAAAR
jgi:Flp pilus assembly protein TadD